MSIHSLYPAFVRIFYQTAVAPHVMTIPTRQWSSSGGDAGSFKAWDDSDREAVDMVGDLVDKLLPFHTPTTSFNQAIIYTMDSDDDPPHPRGFISFTGKDGTSVASPQAASQGMYTFRTDLFGLMKILFFDAPVSTGYVPITDITGETAIIDLFDQLKSNTNAWSGRDNGQPAQFVRATFKLNDKLRQSYHLD